MKQGKNPYRNMLSFRKRNRKAQSFPCEDEAYVVVMNNGLNQWYELRNEIVVETCFTRVQVLFIKASHEVNPNRKNGFTV